MAGERKLAATVHVDGTVYPAGASVPAEVAQLITNRKAWGEFETEADSTSAPESKPKSSSKPPKASSKPKEPAAPAAPESTGDDELVPPPIAGAGSGTQAWLDYAVAATAKAGLNIEFPDDVRREDIVSALNDAGISTTAKE
jgi:hypothetical protein